MEYITEKNCPSVWSFSSIRLQSIQNFILHVETVTCFDYRLFNKNTKNLKAIKLCIAENVGVCTCKLKSCICTVTMLLFFICAYLKHNGDILSDIISTFQEMLPVPCCCW
jgi:hypothetical protein